MHIRRLPVNHAERRSAGAVSLLFCLLLACGMSSAGSSAQESSPHASRPNSPRSRLPSPETAIALPGHQEPVESLDWADGRYRLTASDVLDLRFPYVPEFDQTVTVQPDGYVSLRVVGDLRVQGRTLPQLKAMLNEAYSGILREPVVNIILREFEKPYFVVAGEVARPGKYELRSATTLTQGLALAGGQTRSAKHSQVILFRRFSAELLEVKEVDVKKMYATRDLSEDPLVRPGDTVFVPRSVWSKITPFIPVPSWGIYINPFQ